MSWFTAPTPPVPLIVTHWRFRSIHWLFLSICSLICTCASASKAPLNLNAYDPEVAALLEEYQAESDAFGSMLPSVLAYRGATKADTLVDFARGIISITAPDSASIRRAAIEIILTQIDPSVIDAATANDFGLINSKTQKPFFYQQIIDQDGLPIASVWRAERFVDRLIKQQASTQGRSLTLALVGQHKAIAGAKYIQFAKTASIKHRIPVPLIMAIIETESSFNPMARSRSNALGLMQIKADTAGRDYFSIIKGYAHTPTSGHLYTPSNNVEIGTGYLSILADRYLAGIYHPLKLQYAIISSYNGGAGNLYKSLAPNGSKKAAIARVNAMTVDEFYWFLTNRHIRAESRNYVKKVTRRMKKYENIQ